ncbi:unnamed protein product [Anisakis simplex]|uniref:SSD domain-containing protein n=1 Tax=Anisakis simplex TaxID=6269 RepID=A0A0M3JJ60_ANISI|nr:unnamed protein product [Anisakis simplex]
MSVVCFIFVPSIINTFLATLSILSISCSLLGMLSWWNLDMDPITMVNVLMGIGFSVDFSAHICYHFHKSQLMTTTSKTEYSSSQQHENAKVLRLANVFNAVASPVIEVVFK